MAIRTEEQEQAGDVSVEFPYAEFIAHPAWPVLEKALDELQSNDDLELRTAPRYVVGYLIKELAKHGLTPPAFKPAPTLQEEKAITYRWVLQVEVERSAPPANKPRQKKSHSVK